MGIKYAVATLNSSFIRPTGYTFPTGLTQLVVEDIKIDYLALDPH